MWLRLVSTGYVSAVLTVLSTNMTLADATTSLTLAHMFPDDSVANKAAQQFSDLLWLRSFNRYGTEIVGNALLGDESHNVQQLRDGEIQFAITGDVLVSQLLPEMSAVNLPFLYPDIATAVAAYDDWIGGAVREGLHPYGIELLSWHCIGERVLTANHPVQGERELQGLNLRVPVNPVLTQAWSALGADVSNIPFPELAAALSIGTVDAQENPPSIIRSSKLYQEQGYLMLSNHYTQFQFILASQAFFEAQSAEAKEMIRQAAQEVSTNICASSQQGQQRDIDWLLNEGGMKLVAFDKAFARGRMTEFAHRLSPTPPDWLMRRLGLADGN